MRAAVTGGAGFIGSHLVDRLADDGHEVLAIDDLSRGSRRNLEQHDSSSRVTFVESDVAQADLVAHLQDVDWLFHLAGLADIVPSIEQPVDYYRANVTGTVNVLEAARAAGVGRLVYAASSSCYGIPDVIPTPETAPARPQYPYALTKYLGEQCALHWCQVYDLPVVSLRLFNVYGPRSRTSSAYGAVFGVFLAQKLAQKPFTVVGDGSQRRDFTYVSDVTDACVAAARSKLSGEVLNVGSSACYSVNRLVELLGGGEVVRLPKRPGEPECTQADISKIRRLLGYEPKISFEQGVAQMLQHIDHWRDAPLWTAERIMDSTRAWFAHLGQRAER